MAGREQLATGDPFELWEEGEGIRLERCRAVARIVLNRPERRNALTTALVEELRGAVARCRDPDVRAVILTGAGHAFCAGADLSPEERPGRESAARATYEKLVDTYHPTFAAIRTLAKPVIAAVNGPAVGVGCTLALCGDLVLCADAAFFQLAFVNFGLIPDGGASVWVPRRIGAARALEMSLLGERVEAVRAAEWGLVNRVHPAEELVSASVALAERLSRGPTRAYAGIKRLAETGSFGSLDHQLEREARLQAEMAASEDHHEALAAYRDGRPPCFRGR